MFREGHAAAAAPLPRRRDALLSILVDVKGHNRAPQNRAPAHTSAPRGEATARRANDAWAQCLTFTGKQVVITTFELF